MPTVAHGPRTDLELACVNLAREGILLVAKVVSKRRLGAARIFFNVRAETRHKDNMRAVHYQETKCVAPLSWAALAIRQVPTSDR